ncbi:MAG: M23 family metallopeptidase [Clostridia bacterium]|nr:M23 family metallopeptidase [Clostridia bacterium]
MDNRFYKIGTCIGIIIIIAIIACIVTAKKKDKQIAKEGQSLMSSASLLESEEENTSETKSDEFNMIEEKKEDTNKAKNENRSEIKDEGKNKIAKVDEKKKQEEKKIEPVKDPTFVYPVQGEIMQDYAKDQLVYSQTLGEWITHTGIDIKANKTTVVNAAADGKVKYIKNDPRYGLTVIMEHANGFSTVYSNLLTTEFVSIGEELKSGQPIGTVGNTAAFEILDEPHLHFEILKEGEAVDPNMYLKN